MILKAWLLPCAHSLHLLAAHLLEAILFKAWYMLPTLVLCGTSELIGWAGRYWGHVSPHNKDPFMMQLAQLSQISPHMYADSISRISTTIIAPSFMTAAMFLILPRIINELGSQYSRMPSRWCE